MKHDEARELGQRSECLCNAVRKTARAITRFYDDAFQPSGLLTTQFALLSAVQREGELPITVMADRLDLDRTTLTRNLRVLQTKGLITVGPGQDRRTKAIKLTAAGHAAQREARPYWKKAQEMVVADIGPARFKTLIKELAALRTLRKESI